MTNNNNNNDDEQVAIADSPGKQLTVARERMGLTQQQVADNLRLRLNTIITLENDELEKGVSLTFTKGYVRLYAKLVHLDSSQLLTAFENIHASADGPAKLQSFSRRVEREAHDSRWNLVTFVVIFLVGASLVYWWYDTHGKDSVDFLNTQPVVENEVLTSDELELTAAPDETEAENEAALTFGATDSLQEGASDPAVQPDDASISLTQPADVVDTNDLQNDATQSLPSEPQVPDLEEQNQLTTVAITPDISDEPQPDPVSIQFTFLADCWLNVTDASLEPIAYGTKTQGYVMTIEGIPPITINLCPPERVAIEYNGEPVDLSRYNQRSSTVVTLPLTRN